MKNLKIFPSFTYFDKLENKESDNPTSYKIKQKENIKSLMKNIYEQSLKDLEIYDEL